MSMAYSFGVLGGDLSVSNSSNPLTMNMNNCIQISNGIAKFSSVNNGSFVNTCVVDLNYSKLIIFDGKAFIMGNYEIPNVYQAEIKPHNTYFE
jgi:hypothetical protein